MSDDNDWIFEHVSAIFKSPAWEADVFGFIDENCLIFTAEEENRFEYTTLHDDFTSLIERHLNSKLLDFGISEETFYEACLSSRFNTDVNKNVYEQLSAMDDFATFKKLMVRRNRALELEVLRAHAIANSGANAGGARREDTATTSTAATTATKQRTEAGDDDDDDEALRKALKMSQEEMQATESSRLLAIEAVKETGGGGKGVGGCATSSPSSSSSANASSPKRSGGGGGGGGGVVPHDENELKRAMDLNLTALDLFHRQEEFEQQQLEEVLALSLMLHEEELRERRREAKRTDMAGDGGDYAPGKAGRAADDSEDEDSDGEDEDEGAGKTPDISHHQGPTTPSSSSSSSGPSPNPVRGYASPAKAAQFEDDDNSNDAMTGRRSDASSARGAAYGDGLLLEAGGDPVVTTIAEAKVAQEVVLTAKVTSPSSSSTTTTANNPAGRGGAVAEEKLGIFSPSSSETNFGRYRNANDDNDRGGAKGSGGGADHPTRVAATNVVEAVPAVEATVVGNSEGGGGGDYMLSQDEDFNGEVRKKKKKSSKEKKEKKAKKERSSQDDNYASADAKDGDSLSSLSGLPSIKSLGGGILGGLRPLGAPTKSIEELTSEIARQRQQAMETGQRNHELLEEQRKNAEELKKQAKLTEDDM